jgi:hypothetical protein
MSDGSGASNLGYGNQAPLSNVNGAYVNIDNSNSPALFSSNEIPGLPGLAGAKSNIDAAAGVVPGICMFKGGARGLKRKIKNISKRYRKMKNGSRKVKSLKSKIRSRMSSASRSLSGGKRRKTCGKKCNRRSRRRQRGGYSQYENNMHRTPTFSVGGVLSPANLALANPPPIQPLSNCVNCVDNYNHYTNSGFPSRGN